MPEAGTGILSPCYFIEPRTNDYPASSVNQTPCFPLDDRRDRTCPLLIEPQNLSLRPRGTSFAKDVLNHLIGYILLRVS